MYRRLPVALISIILSSAAFAPHAAAVQPQYVEPVRTSDDAVALRAAFGLRSDRSFVGQLTGAPDPLLGIPTTAAEHADLEQRRAVQEALGPVHELAAKTASFGGMYLDQRAGGRLVINLTADASDAVRTTFRSAAPEGAVVTFATVRHTLADLLAVHAALLARAGAQPLDQHVGIGAIGTDEVANVVRVGVVGDDSKLREALVAEFGDQIEMFTDEAIVDDVCSNRSSCTPYRAGLQTYNAAHGTCTTGFMSKNLVQNIYYILTAGHCAAVGAAMFHDEVQMGTIARRVYYEGATNDSGAISQAGTTNHKNWIYVTSGEPSRTVTAKEGQNADTAGEGTCLSGFTSGFSCGVMQVKDWDNVWDGTFHFNNLRSGNYIGTGGDSGGPIFYGHKAIGLHKGHLGTLTYYSHIWEVEQNEGILVLLAPV